MAHFILPQNNMLVRALTASAIALAIGATFFQMYDRIHYYRAHPLVAVVTETEQDNQTMPAVIVCPGGQFRPSQAYHRFGIFDSFYRGSMDLKHIEEHRNEIIVNMKKRNITITSDSIAYLELELGRINAVLSDKIKRGVTIDLTASWWKEILTSLSNLTDTFQYIFPIMMSKLSAKEPFAFRKLPLNITGWYNSHQAFEIAKAFELFRHENMLSKLDVCTDVFLLSDNRTWAELFPEILQCRLGDVNTEPSILRDVHHIQLYPVVVNFLRTASKDLILNCIWMGNACTITDVWTALGKCFRVGPQDESGAFVDRVGDDVSSVNILIDTLNNEFSNKQSKIYFYPQNETEFAQITGGIAIKSGMVSHVSINQIRKSIRDPQNCGTRELLKFKRYTKEKCVWEQKTNPIAVKCGCISDLAPDYFSYATKELSRMTTAEIYLNKTNKFCSLGENLICAPNSIATAYDCPNNCVEVKYEVDMITGHIDDKLIFSRLPLGFDENQVNSLEKLSEYGAFQTAPGYDQLNVVLEQLFEYHLRMMEMFWWKKDENPYYPTWFNNRADYGYGTRGSYFGLPPYVTSSIMPCFEDSFNPA
uniref:Uncharacterized protein n=1 Tax=Plectus sambesii TaxID=2011161 RepID=A0A914VTV4_9BILA